MKPDEQTSEEQPKPEATKGLMAELPDGGKVSGWQLKNGSFRWVFTNENGIKTVLLLSQEATYAFTQIAEALSHPGTTEAA